MRVAGGAEGCGGRGDWLERAEGREMGRRGIGEGSGTERRKAKGQRGKGGRGWGGQREVWEQEVRVANLLFAKAQTKPGKLTHQHKSCADPLPCSPNPTTHILTHLVCDGHLPPQPACAKHYTNTSH